MRVLVVDDSMLFRKVVRDALALEPAIEVVGSAADGRAALDKIDQFQPDAITLDLEMPEVDGLGVLRELREQPNPPGVIVVSALTDAGRGDDHAGPAARRISISSSSPTARISTRTASSSPPICCQKSACWPSVGSLCWTSEHSAAKCDLSHPRIQIAADSPSAGAKDRGDRDLDGRARRAPRDAARDCRPICPCQSSSCSTCLPSLPALWPTTSTETRPSTSPRPTNGQRLQAGTVYIAPGGLQTRIERQLRGLKLCVTDDPPEKCCKPSVDYLFRSLAQQLGARRARRGHDRHGRRRARRLQVAQAARSIRHRPRRRELRRLWHATSDH